MTGAAPGVFRSKALEDALAKSFTADAAKAVKIDAKGLNGDLHASPEYRAHLIAVLAARAVPPRASRRADLAMLSGGAAIRSARFFCHR